MWLQLSLELLENAFVDWEEGVVISNALSLLDLLLE